MNEECDEECPFQSKYNFESDGRYNYEICTALNCECVKYEEVIELEKSSYNYDNWLKCTKCLEEGENN